MRHLLSALILLALSLHARAETETLKVAHCQAEGLEFSLLLPKDTAFQEGTSLVVVSSEVSHLTGLNVSTNGVLRQSQGFVELPTYWRPTKISLNDCAWIKTFHSAPRLRGSPLQDVFMYMQTYFLAMEPSPDIDIDELVRSGDAIPLKVHVVCRTREPESGLLGCEQVRILDKIVPVDTSQKPVRTENFALKLESSICGSSEKISSTATVINWQGQNFVLASAGAVMSDRGMNSCTHALLSDSTQLPLSLKRHDWAMGLALLESPSLAPAKSLVLNPIQTNDAPDSVVIMGYGKKGGAIEQRLMNVLSASSSRHFIPSAARALELRGGIVDSGWMGAPVLNDSKQMIGLVSHQHLRIYPGSLTRPTRWNPKMPQTTDHLVAITASDIVKWLKSENSARLWPMDQTQLTESLKLASGQLVIEENCPSMDATRPDDSYPIGGVDAVGIGGDPSNYRGCQIKVSMNGSGESAFFSPSLQAWHDQVVSTLKQGHTAEALFAAWRDSSHELQRSYFYSAESFFQQLRDFDGKSLVTILHPSGSSNAGLESHLAPLRLEARTLARSAKSLYSKFQVADLRVPTLIRKAYFFAALVQSEQWQILEPDDFTELLDLKGPHAWAWNMITSMAPGGVGFRESAERVQDEFLKVAP